MSNYLCDTCGTLFPGGCTGSTFLVKPNEYTAHACSNACLRAYVNGQPRTRMRLQTYGLVLLSVTLACGVAIGTFAHHVIAH